jgi:hypothetical protein
VTHDWRSNGTIELPIGPNKLLFGNSSGWLGRALERWQLGAILKFEMPGNIRFDSNLSKSFRVTETKSIQLRFDATNVLNHPNPNPVTPVISINDANFGYLTNAKTGNRTFQGQLRLSF